MASIFARFRRRASVITSADRARDSGQMARAARLYRKALRRTPEQPAIWVQYGHVLKNVGDLAAAEAAYRRAIGHQPASYDAQLQLAHLLKSRGRNDAAEAAYLRSLALNQDAPEPLTELAALGWTERELAELKRMVL